MHIPHDSLQMHHPNQFISKSFPKPMHFNTKQKLEKYQTGIESPPIQRNLPPFSPQRFLLHVSSNLNKNSSKKKGEKTRKSATQKSQQPINTEEQKKNTKKRRIHIESGTGDARS